MIKSTNTSLLQLCLGRLSVSDPTACDELISHACDRLRVLTRNLSRGDRVRRFADTDDVLHGAMLSLRSSLRTARPESAAEFLRLAAFHIRRELTRLAREYYGPSGWATRHVLNPAGDSWLSTAKHRARHADLTPSEVASYHEEIQRLYRAVDALSDDLRDVVDLVWLHGFSQKETAKILEVSAHTVGRRWVRARMHLERSLSEDCDLG